MTSTCTRNPDFYVEWINHSELFLAKEIDFKKKTGEKIIWDSEMTILFVRPLSFNGSSSMGIKVLSSFCLYFKSCKGNIDKNQDDYDTIHKCQPW